MSNAFTNITLNLKKQQNLTNSHTVANNEYISSHKTFKTDGKLKNLKWLVGQVSGQAEWTGGNSRWKGNKPQFAELGTDALDVIHTSIDNMQMRLIATEAKWRVKAAAINQSKTQAFVAGATITRTIYYWYDFTGKPLEQTDPDFILPEIGEIVKHGWANGQSYHENVSTTEFKNPRNKKMTPVPATYTVWQVSDNEQLAYPTAAECEKVAHLGDEYILKLYKIETWKPTNRTYGDWPAKRQKVTRHKTQFQGGWYNRANIPTLSIAFEHDKVDSINNIIPTIRDGEDIAKVTYKQLTRWKDKNKQGMLLKRERVKKDLPDEAELLLDDSVNPKVVITGDAAQEPVQFVIDDREAFSTHGKRPTSDRGTQNHLPFTIQGNFELTTGEIIDSEFTSTFNPKPWKTYKVIPCDIDGKELKRAANEEDHDYEITLDQLMSFKFKPMYGAESDQVSDGTACKLHVSNLHFGHILQHADATTISDGLTFTCAGKEGSGSNLITTITGFTYADVKNSSYTDSSSSTVSLTTASHSFIYERLDSSTAQDRVIVIKPQVGGITYDGSQQDYGDGSIKIKLLVDPTPPTITLTNWVKNTGSGVWGRDGQTIETRRAIIEKLNGYISTVQGHTDTRYRNDDRGSGYDLSDDVTVTLTDASNSGQGGKILAEPQADGSLKFIIDSAGSGYIEEDLSLEVTGGQGTPPAVLTVNVSDPIGDYSAPDKKEYYTGDSGITIDPEISGDVSQARLEWQLSSPKEPGRANGLHMRKILDYNKVFNYVQDPEEADDKFFARAPKGTQGDPHISFGDYMDRTLEFNLSPLIAEGEILQLKVLMIANGHRVSSVVKDIYVGNRPEESNPSVEDTVHDLQTSRAHFPDLMDESLNLTNSQVSTYVSQNMLAFSVKTGTVPLVLSSSDLNFTSDPDGGYTNDEALAVHVGFNSPLVEDQVDIVRAKFPALVEGLDTSKWMSVDYVFDTTEKKWKQKRSGANWLALLDSLFKNFSSTVSIEDQNSLPVDAGAGAEKPWLNETQRLVKIITYIHNNISALGLVHEDGMQSTVEKIATGVYATPRVKQLQASHQNPYLGHTQNESAFNLAIVPKVEDAINKLTPGDTAEFEIIALDKEYNELYSASLFIGGDANIPLPWPATTTTTTTTTTTATATTPTTTTTGDFTLFSSLLLSGDSAPDKIVVTWSLTDDALADDVEEFEIWMRSADTGNSPVLLKSLIANNERMMTIRPYPDLGAPEPVSGNGTYDIQVRANFTSSNGNPPQKTQWKTISGIISTVTTTSTTQTQPTMTTSAGSATKLNLMDPMLATAIDSTNTDLTFSWSWSMPFGGTNITKLKLDLYSAWPADNPTLRESLEILNDNSSLSTSGTYIKRLVSSELANFANRYVDGKKFRIKVTPYYTGSSGETAGISSDISALITVAAATGTTTTTTTTTSAINPDPIVWSQSTGNGSDANTYIKFNTTDTDGGDNLTNEFQNTSATSIRSYKIIGDNAAGTSNGLGGTVTDAGGLIPTSHNNWKWRLLGRTLVQGNLDTDGLYYDLELVSDYGANGGTMFIRDVLFLPKSSTATNLSAWTVKPGWQLTGANFNSGRFQNIKLSASSNVRFSDGHDNLANTTTTTLPVNVTSTATTTTEEYNDASTAPA